MEKEVEVKELKQKVKKYTKELKESLTRVSRSKSSVRLFQVQPYLF